MRNFFGGLIAVFWFILAIVTAGPGHHTERKCSTADCVNYGGPNETYSVRVASSTQEASFGGWIVGEIRAFAFGADNPLLIQSLAGNGWVECAGQLIDRKDFPEAAAVLQDNWGEDSTKTQVYLPDLRGLVLRGWHHGRRAPEKYPFSPYTGDVDVASRVFPRPELLDLQEPGIPGPTDSKTKEVIKDHVGSMQAEQLHGHRHSFSLVAGNGVPHIRTESKSNATASGEPVRIGSSTGFEGGNETHPPNVYVLYLIYLGRPAYELPVSEEDQRVRRARRVVIDKN
jgi:hypothetical protein